MTVSRTALLVSGACAAAVALAACSTSGDGGQQAGATPLGLGETPTESALPSPSPTEYANPHFRMRTRAGGPPRTNRKSVAAVNKPFQWLFDKPARSATWCQVIEAGTRNPVLGPWACESKEVKVFDSRLSYRFLLMVGPPSTCTPWGNGYKCRGIHLNRMTSVPDTFTTYTVIYKDGAFTPASSSAATS